MTNAQPGANRPRPPAEVLDSTAPPYFLPAPDLAAWAIATFTAEDSPLFNERHTHLREANLGALWTNASNVAKQRRVIGQAEIPRPPVMGGKWARGRWEMQLGEWFGEIPDFIITLDATLVDELDDVTFCSVVEHELCHCGQALDAFGAPRFNQDGEPIFSLIGHDVEEFVDIVRRYGVGAAAGDTKALFEAASRPPLIGRAMVEHACGTCLRVA